MKPSILLATLLLTSSALSAQEPAALSATSTDTPAAEEQIEQADDQTPTPGQQPVRRKYWSLNECIKYALMHNITVQQRTLQVDQNEIELSTARLSRLPDVGASLGYNANFGRRPSSDNTYKTETSHSGSLSASASMTLFQGFRINKQIKGGKLNLEASVQDLERAREDLSINIMTLYLEVLYSKELLGVAERQLALSTQQTERSRELVATGKQPESTLYESEALAASNRVSLTQSRNDLTLARLNLSQALNREHLGNFDITIPVLDSLTLAGLHQIGTPQAVYDYAVEYRPHIRAERLRVESRRNDIAIARSSLYPTLSLGGGYGTNIYSSSQQDFGTQFRLNRGEYVGVSMNIPIFNRMASRNSIRTAKLALQSQQLTLTEEEQSLRKQIEQAWQSADAAYSKYCSSEAAFASARVAFSYEQQKADAGRSTIFDFNDAKTRMEKAEADLIQAKYEFVFQSKILDFYRGIPIQL